MLHPGQYTFQITVTDATGEQVFRSLSITVESTLSGHAPSGRRTVVAGGMVSLPDRSDATATWGYDLPDSLRAVRTSDGSLWLRAGAHSTGRYVVPLQIGDGVTTLRGSFVVTVLPHRVASGSYRLGAGLTSTLRWARWAGATGYRVYVGDKLVGRTSTPSLSLARPLGPRSVVTVRTEGNDRLLAAARRLRYVAPATAARASVGAVVYFGTDLSNLDKGDRVILQRLSDAIRAAGLRHIRITGFTDSRGSVVRNQALSDRRAAAVSGYLKGRLKGLGITWQGRSEHAPAASNATPAGMALNRRVEVKVW